MRIFQQQLLRSLNSILINHFIINIQPLRTHQLNYDVASCDHAFTITKASSFDLDSK